MTKKAIIIGAGPAGLTASYELLNKTEIQPVILEASNEIGGISRTVNYKGNRMDIGGHRFFSKSDVVMNWWLNIMPIENTKEEFFKIKYQNKEREIQNQNKAKENSDLVLLVRDRLSRIYFLRKFFNYPISLSITTLKYLGIVRTIKIGVSYIKINLFPIKEEKSLEDFMINRFGMELYNTFFKDYTEKVWGVPCHEISSEWGAQRIKGLSITKVILNALKVKKSNDISQKDTETSLIERFLYPKLGPGQLWEEVSKICVNKGAELYMNEKVIKVQCNENLIQSVTTIDNNNNEKTYNGDYFFSTMPVKDLINAMDIEVPQDVKRIANGLIYRDFITVGLLLNKLNVSYNDQPIKDNWIYIQESDVKIGRLQIFNNWSPYLVNDPTKTWIGLEYFCNEGDSLWEMNEETFKEFAIKELEKIGIISSSEVLDGVVIKVPKTYPAYFGTYDEFDIIKNYISKFTNLFLVGRNGMHKYNNQDHSMLTAIQAVDNIKNNITTKDNIWDINTEQEYHEEK